MSHRTNSFGHDHAFVLHYSCSSASRSKIRAQRMPCENDRLTVGPIPAKFDRPYKASGRTGNEIVEVNVARLECTCSEWRAQRAQFLADDARRVCEHLYDTLNSTKVERTFDRL